MSETFQYVRRRKHILPVNSNPFTTKWMLRNGVYRQSSEIYECKSVKWLERYHPEDVEEFIEEVLKQNRFDHWKDKKYSAANQITTFISWDQTQNPDKWNDYYHEAMDSSKHFYWDDNV